MKKNNKIILGGAILIGATYFILKANGSPSQNPQPLKLTISSAYINQSDVQFTATATGGTPPYRYYWSFGDGGQSQVQNPTHPFNTGYHIVMCTVIDAVNTAISTVIEITVN